MNKIFLSAYKQTLYLNKGNADTPLTAVDTLTSQLCCSAKVMEKTFHRHPERSEESCKTHFKGWILHFASAPFRMTLSTIILAAVLSTILVRESLADEINCLIGQQSCGINCYWSYDSESKKLSITGGKDGSVGTMDNYSWSGANADYKTNTPWDAYRSHIESVDIKGIENIGNNAFKAFIKIKEVNIGNSVETIGKESFWTNNIKNLQIPDSVKSIGAGAFSWNNNLSMTIPDMLDNIEKQKFLSKIHIVCKGEENLCSNIQANLDIEGEYEFMLANKDQCTGAQYYWSGAKCKNKKNGIKCAASYSLDYNNNCIICNKQGYRNVDGYCNRIRYTPAEAAKVLQDTGNEIIMIFKANR